TRARVASARKPPSTALSGTPPRIISGSVTSRSAQPAGTVKRGYETVRSRQYVRSSSDDSDTSSAAMKSAYRTGTGSTGGTATSSRSDRYTSSSSASIEWELQPSVTAWDWVNVIRHVS